MLNIDEIQNGIVIDHIKAGTAMGLMDLLGIKGNRTANVALIQNARSHKAECGRKDIIKVEGDASWLNLDVLAYLDPGISVTIIENGKAVRKEKTFVAVVGMRVDARTRAAGELERFLEQYELPVLAYLRDTQAYVQAAAHGLTLFDLPAARVEKDLAQWQPILDWVEAD